MKIIIKQFVAILRLDKSESLLNNILIKVQAIMLQVACLLRCFLKTFIWEAELSRDDGFQEKPEATQILYFQRNIISVCRRN